MECLPHPRRGKKYQWGFEYESLPEGYVGDDRDEGRQMWLDAGGVIDGAGFTNENNGEYPLGEDEDAEGEGEEFDAVRYILGLE